MGYLVAIMLACFVAGINTMGFAAARYYFGYRVSNTFLWAHFLFFAMAASVVMIVYWPAPDPPFDLSTMPRPPVHAAVKFCAPDPAQGGKKVCH